MSPVLSAGLLEWDASCVLMVLIAFCSVPLTEGELFENE